MVHIYYDLLLGFLVNLKTLFWYNKCQNWFFFFEILKIKQFYLSSCYQTFQKKQRGTNLWEGTNTLSFYTYVVVLCLVLWKNINCHWMRNIKITFMYVILKINQVNISNTPQVLQKLLEKLISEGELIF